MKKQKKEEKWKDECKHDGIFYLSFLCLSRNLISQKRVCYFLSWNEKKSLISLCLDKAFHHIVKKYCRKREEKSLNEDSSSQFIKKRERHKLAVFVFLPKKTRLLPSKIIHHKNKFGSFCLFCFTLSKKLVPLELSQNIFDSCVFCYSSSVY